MNGYTYLTLGVICIVGLICFTIMAILNAAGLDTMRDVLLGLVAGLTGGYAINRFQNKKEDGNGTTGSK